MFADWIFQVSYKHLKNNRAFAFSAATEHDEKRIFKVFGRSFKVKWNRKKLGVNVQLIETELKLTDLYNRAEDVRDEIMHTCVYSNRKRCS